GRGRAVIWQRGVVGWEPCILQSDFGDQCESATVHRYEITVTEIAAVHGEIQRLVIIGQRRRAVLDNLVHRAISTDSTGGNPRPRPVNVNTDNPTLEVQRCGAGDLKAKVDVPISIRGD